MGGLRAASWVPIALAMLLPIAAEAQRGGWFDLRAGTTNPPYNGRFTFSRVSYSGGWGWGGGAWAHDYPQADLNLPRILDAITAIRPNLDVSNVFDLEDPEIFRNPILYMWEPGFWQPTDAGLANLRAFMLKGGFVIFDDFEAGQWANFEHQFRRALPEAQFIELDTTHPLFHGFFEMDTIDIPHPSVQVVPVYYGVFADNDPSGRPMALATYNNDVAEYWEWSGQGRFPVDTTNDAYKLGVNFMVYALTH